MQGFNKSVIMLDYPGEGIKQGENIGNDVFTILMLAVISATNTTNSKWLLKDIR